MFTILWILIVGLTKIRAADYILLIEDSDFYTPCTEGPPGSIGMNEAYDVSELVVDMDEEGLHVSGNITTLWDFPRTDRISARLNVLRFNRGSWEPTLYSVHTPDFCAVMFDPNLFWYNCWFKNLANREEIQEKCIATKGTVMQYNSFIVTPRLNNVMVGPTIKRRFKLVFTFEAFDENNQRRPTSVCFELTGEAEKVRT
ncbi:uncharacterized protein LOC108089809 [Drosophila ficusphila]|uniref:uncharacterized protein LOC108089809 n=1 Tax=Drosophila ficusphila TaxID=30025 RepID=UPI0007E815C2|nr:uncharacterized protein LOC108089809 [Drosophila ficusphila]